MSPKGPIYAGSAADGGGGQTAWTTPANATGVADGNVAVNSWASGGASSNNLLLTNFGINIPSTAVIDGIYVEILRSGSAAAENNVQLVIGGATAGSNLSTGNGLPTTLTWQGYGGASNLWGLSSITPAQINASNFGVAFAAYNTHGGGQANVDAVRITVYWHTGPAKVPGRLIHHVFNAAGTYLGILPKVKSNLEMALDINTSGTQITVEVGVSADTSALPADIYTDETGNPYTDETGSVQYTDEGQIPIISPGNAGYDTLIKNGNRLLVYEVNYYYPNGKLIFSGQMNRISAKFGTDDTIKIMAYSDGQDLDNYAARGAPFSYTTDQSNTSYDTAGTIDSNRGGYHEYGQTITIGTGVTNIGQITVMLNGTAKVTLQLWDGPAMANLLGSISQSVSVSVASAIQFAFATPVAVSAGQTPFFSLSVQDGQSISVYYQATGAYAGGAMYAATYGGGGGGGGFAVTNSDLYFTTGSSTGSTSATYTNQDPTTGMLKPIIDDYRGRGGLINYGSNTVDATGLSLTYFFNTNTIYEALQAILSISPSGFYYYVDPGTNVLYFKQSATTPDFYFTKGNQIEELELISTIENVKNQVLFTGGVPSGQTNNLYKQYQNQKSIAQYGVRLERKSDNRVTVAATADAIGNSAIATSSAEQYQSVVTISAAKMDITLLVPGKIIGFNGFGTFVDQLQAQIVRVEYAAGIHAKLTLGIIPKRITPAFEKITRGLIAQQTIANPSAPS